MPSAPTSTDALPSTLRIWIGGAVVDDPAQARVGVTDHGLVVGDGVFESLKVTSAGPFAVRRHLIRLSRSAAALGLPALDQAQVWDAIDAVLDGFAAEFGRLRITYTGGRGPLASQAAYGPTTLVVAAEATHQPAPSAAIVTAPWTRNERGALAGVKSTSYAENVRALAWAAERGASEAIFANTVGNLCEGTGTNVFVVRGGVVITPPLSAGALGGITRELVLEWYPVEERDLTVEDARSADEVFLTSSLRDVQRVHRWDDRRYGDGHPVTDTIAATFAARSAADVDP